MKRLYFAALLMLVCTSAFAATVDLSWEDPNPPEAGVKVFKVYFGNVSGNSKVFPFKRYTTVQAPTTSVSVKVTDTEKWFFRVTAGNSITTTEYSNVAQVLFIRTPKNLKFQRIDMR